MRPRRKPDEVVGPASGPRSRRWYLFRCRLFDACVHEFLRPDPPGLHDHHAWNVTVVLRGALFEELSAGHRYLQPGSVVFRRAETAHRLTPVGRPLTLFVIGHPKRKWGYWREGKWTPFDRS